MSILTSPTEQQTHWQQQISHWRQSGLSQTAFCDAHNLVYHQFVYWRRKLTANSAPATTPSNFVTVQRAENPDKGLTLILPSGIRIQNLTPQHLTWLPQLLAHLS